MASGLYRLGRWCFRHRALVLVSWLVVLVAVGALALTVKQPLNNSFTIPGTQSQQALDLLNEKFPGTGGTQAQVVFSVPAGETLTAPAQKQAIENTLAQLRKDPQVILVTDPFTSGTVSKNGQIAYSTVAYPVPVGNVTTAARNALLNSGGPAKAAGIAVNFGGQIAQASTTSDTEIVGVFVAFIILLIGFGSISASLLPLLAAIIGVAVSDLTLLALTSVVNESSTTPILAVMIGLAVGIDYSLFVMNRYRQLLIADYSSEEAAGRAVATSGSAVCFAGLTVLIALVALAVVNIPFLTVMGLAAGGAVICAVAVATTLVPALLGFFGTRTVASKWAQRKIAKAKEPDFVPLSRRYVLLLKRGPIAVAAVVVIALLFIASPALHMRLGLPDAGSQPTSQTVRRAYDLISEGFGPGANGPLLVVVYAPGGATPAQVKGFSDYYTKTKAHLPPSIASIGNPIINSTKDVALITITPTTGPDDPATTTLINQIRQVAVEGQKLYGLETFVTGQTALNIDISSKLSSALPLYLAVIVIVCLVILLLVFRSLLVPLTAVAGYVLSVLAAFGAVTFVFQQGHLNGLFGIASPGPVLSFLPIILLGILFGLAMDYEVFLVSRMREEYVHENATEAVTDGYTGSAKVVTSAAIIMISVFASFIFSPDPTTKSLGFGLALGVLLDAFIVRMTLIPATMYLYKKAAWWLPHLLGRILPDIDIEGQKLDTELVDAT